MSWEVMQDETRKCDCGKGETRYISEMNDWNNSRSKEYITCNECYKLALISQANSNKCGNVAKHDDTTYIYRQYIK